MKTKHLVAALLVRLALWAVFVVPVFTAGRMLGIPEIVTSGVALVVVLAFSWFQERLVAWIFPRFAAPAGRRANRAQ